MEDQDNGDEGESSSDSADEDEKTKRTQLEIIRHYIKRVAQLDHYGTFIIDEKANHDYKDVEKKN